MYWRAVDIDTKYGLQIIANAMLATGSLRRNPTRAKRLDEAIEIRRRRATEALAAVRPDPASPKI